MTRHIFVASLMLAGLLPATPANAQSSMAPAAKGETAGGETSRAQSGRQSAGQARNGRDTEPVIQEAPSPGIPGGEQRLKRLKAAPGADTQGGPAPPAR